MKAKRFLRFATFGLCLWFSNNAAAESCDPIPLPLTFEKLSHKLQNCPVFRIEELLPLLPSEYRSRHVLVYASRSLQSASATFPRVILFGFDARFIIAFSGDPNRPGYELLETIEFDDQEKIFQFRSITFPSEISAKESRIHPYPSEKNPLLCANCHREELRPNWDTYSAWPGVYGSHNDVYPGPENRDYKIFQENIFRKIGRYRHLENAEAYPDSSWYLDYYVWGRPNLQFTWLLSLLNSQSIARSIKKTKSLHPYRYALLASLTCPLNFEDPDVVSQWLPSISPANKVSYPAIAQEVRQSITDSYRMREKRQCEVLQSLNRETPLAGWECSFQPRELDFADRTSRLKYVMEAANVPFSPTSSMEFGSKNYVFFGGATGQVGELGLFLWRELLDPEVDREIYEIYLDAWNNKRPSAGMYFSEGTENVCRQLQAKNSEALTGIAQKN